MIHLKLQIIAPLQLNINHFPWVLGNILERVKLVIVYEGSFFGYVMLKGKFAIIVI